MKWRYRAVNAQKLETKGTMEAVTSAEVAKSLLGQKLTPITIAADTSLGLDKLKLMWGRVTETEVTNFTRQLATMITAGLPLTDALAMLKLQSGPSLSATVEQMLKDVQEGTSLSGSMAKYPRVFSPVYVALVKAGEAAGVMETVLDRLATNLEKGHEFSGKVKGALVYPAIVVIGMVVVMIIMLVVVVPKLTEVYSQFGAQLPFMTRVLVAVSSAMVNFWWLILVIIVGLGFVIQKYLAQPEGRRKWENLLYRVPIIGPLLQKIMLTEMTRTLGLLVGSGVSIIDALNIVVGAIGNQTVATEVKKIARQVEKGFPVSVAFGEAASFPPLMGQMIAVGEETGKLDDVLNKLSHYYEVESEQQVKVLTTAIEPLIMVVLGVGVGFLVWTIILPIYDITNKF